MVRPKALGFAILAVLLSMAFTSSASAHEFHAESTPASLEGISITPFYVETPGMSVDYQCDEEKSWLRGTAAKTPLGSLTLTPEFQNCTPPETAITLTIHLNGCKFLIQGATGESGHAPLAIQCEAGKTVELRVETASGSLCTAKIGSQTPAGGVAYENQGLGTARDFKATLTLSEITYTTVNYNPLVGCSVLFGNGKDLSMSGSFTMQGFSESTGIQMGVWVE